VVRLFLLSSHYRGPIDYADLYLDDAQTRVERIYQFKARVKRLKGTCPIPKDLQKSLDSFLQGVGDAMDDDFNTPKAIGQIFEIIRSANILFDHNPEGNRLFGDEVVKKIEKAAEDLGIFQLAPEEWLQRVQTQGDAGVDAKQVEDLIAKRKKARQEKDWAMADQVRDELLALNVILEDTPQGTVWRIKK
jgi:cysteinyl-tRNA synthetase